MSQFQLSMFSTHTGTNDTVIIEIMKMNGDGEENMSID